MNNIYNRDNRACITLHYCYTQQPPPAQIRCIIKAKNIENYMGITKHLELVVEHNMTSYYEVDMRTNLKNGGFF